MAERLAFVVGFVLILAGAGGILGDRTTHHLVSPTPYQAADSFDDYLTIGFGLWLTTLSLVLRTARRLDQLTAPPEARPTQGQPTTACDTAASRPTGSEGVK